MIHLDLLRTHMYQPNTDLIFYIELISLEKVNNTEPTQPEDAVGACWMFHTLNQLEF